MKTARSAAPAARFSVLRLIALFKLGKVALLLLTAYGVLRLRDASVVERLGEWAATIPSGIEHRMVQQALAWVSGLTPGRISALGFVTLAYAAIFTLEGVGLWLGKRWAEWLTVIVTGSLIPLEVWELIRKPHIGKVAVLAFNIAIVWYLIVILRKQASRH